jgi:hypothetical protein
MLFSAEMDASSVVNNFTLKQSNEPVAGTLVYDNKTATFTPASALGHSLTYTAQLTTGAMDAAGTHLASDYSWSFTTIAQGSNGTVVSITAPPTVTACEEFMVEVTITNVENMTSAQIRISYDPAVIQVNFTAPESNKTGFEAGIIPFLDWGFPSHTQGAIIMLFSLRSGSVSGDGFLIKIPFKAVGSPGQSDLRFYSSVDFKNELYSSSLGDIVCHFIDNIITVDATLPAVTSVSPADNATGVAVNPTLNVVFSEDMDSASINTTTFTLSQNSQLVEGIVSYDTSSRTASFTPSDNLTGGLVYTAELTTGITDSAGNALAVNYLWGFTTIVPESSRAVVSFKIPDNVTLNQEFQVEVKITNVQDFQGAQIQISYDPIVIQVTTAEGSKSGFTIGKIGDTIIPFDQWAFYPPDSVPPSQGTMRLIFHIVDDTASGDGFLIRIPFRAVSGGQCNLTFTNTIYFINELINTYYGIIYSQFNGGIVTVAGP